MIGRFPLGSKNGHPHDIYPQEWEPLLRRNMFLDHYSESISRKLQNQTGYLSFPTGVRRIHRIGIQTFSFTPCSEMIRWVLHHVLVLRFDAKDTLCPPAHYSQAVFAHESVTKHHRKSKIMPMLQKVKRKVYWTFPRILGKGGLSKDLVSR